MYNNMNLTQYLSTLYGVHNSNVDFIRHVQPLYGKLNFRPEKYRILIEGLIATALGSYNQYDQKLMALADETIEKYSPLI